MNYQKIILVGNATDAAKVAKPEGKTAYADVTVAVNRSHEEADFFPVRAFGKLVDVVAKIEKGAKVLVEGRVQIDRYSPEEGETRTTVRVLADTIRLD
ncbi:MAG: single-stranded DNA-binding protein [Candidatus Binatia bacterium]